MVFFLLWGVSTWKPRYLLMVGELSGCCYAFSHLFGNVGP